MGNPWESIGLINHSLKNYVSINDHNLHFVIISVFPTQ